MENELNRRIREVLELFEVDTTTFIGEWNIIGHLKDAVGGIIRTDSQTNTELNRELVHPDLLTREGEAE